MKHTGEVVISRSFYCPVNTSVSINLVDKDKENEKREQKNKIGTERKDMARGLCAMRAADSGSIYSESTDRRIE